MTHTIASNPQRHWTIVVDETPPVEKVPVLSYLFGAVAQCTWHSQNAPSTIPGGSFKACVEKVGVRDFKSLQCAGE